MTPLRCWTAYVVLAFALAASVPGRVERAAAQSDSEECNCSDVQPGRFSCNEERDFGKCAAGWMVSGSYCDRTCGRCSCPGDCVCTDVPPGNGEYTCEEQRLFGQCEDGWMIDGGWCAETCGRCSCPESDSDPLEGVQLEGGEEGLLGPAVEELEDDAEVPDAAELFEEAEGLGAGLSATAAPSDLEEEEQDAVDLVAAAEAARQAGGPAVPSAPPADSLRASAVDPASLTAVPGVPGAQVLDPEPVRPPAAQAGGAGAALDTDDGAAQEQVRGADVAAEAAEEEDGAAVEEVDEPAETDVRTEADGPAGTDEETDEPEVRNEPVEMDEPEETDEPEEPDATVEADEPEEPEEPEGRGATEAAEATEPAGVEEEEAAAPPPCTSSVAEQLEEMEGMTLLLEAASAVGLSDVLEQTEVPITLFAPTDEAFESLLEALGLSIEELAGESPGTLQSLLAYHIVPRPISADGLVSEPITDTLLPDSDLLLDGDRVEGMGTRARVLEAGIEACAYIHTIDAVLLPAESLDAIPLLENPIDIAAAAEASSTGSEASDDEEVPEETAEECVETETALSTLQARSDATAFLQLAQAVGIAESLGDAETPLTVFVPDNDALLGALEEIGVTLDDATSPENIDTIEEIVRLHVVPSDVALTADDLAALTGSTLGTLGEDVLVVEAEGSELMVFSPGTVAAVSEADADASCAHAVHIIDNLLLPLAPQPEAAGTAAPGITSFEAQVPASAATPADDAAAVPEEPQAQQELEEEPATAAAGAAAGPDATAAAVEEEPAQGQGPAGGAQDGEAGPNQAGASAAAAQAEADAAETEADAAQPDATTGRNADEQAAATGTEAQAAPDCSTVLDLVLSVTELSTLGQVVQTLEDVQALLADPEAEMTVFAPTNGAFEQMLADLGPDGGLIASDPAALQAILLYHVVPGAQVDSAAFAVDDVLPTLLELPDGSAGELTVTAVSPTVTVEGSLGGSSSVSLPDVSACNSIVHVVDSVLLPQAVLGTPASASPAGK